MISIWDNGSVQRVQSENLEVAERRESSGANAVRLYLAHLEDFETSHCVTLLDRGEIDAARRMTSEASRNTFVRSRAVLRHVLMKELGRPPASLRIGYGESGKPLLPAVPELHFNLSHRDGRALIGVSQLPIGVDIERIDETVPHAEIAFHFFTPKERSVVEGTKFRPQRARQFFRIWTLKEAYLKGLGFGLCVDPRNYDVSDRKVVRVGPSRAVRDASWALSHFQLASRYAAALAVKNAGAFPDHSLKRVFPSELQIA